MPGSTLPPTTNEDPAVEAVLAPAAAYATASAAQVALADLERPSACPDWTVGEVLTHLTRSLQCLAVSLASGSVPAPVAPSRPRPTTAGTLRRELSGAAAGLVSAARGLRGRRSVAVDGLPLRCHQLILVGAIEAAAHGWDATRGARPIPDDLAARLLAELPLVIDRNTRRGSFADPLPLPPDRPPAERLLAALGRDPRAGVRRVL